MTATSHISTVHSGRSQPPAGAVWTGLGVAQAKGRACVLCTATLRGPVAVMVGRSGTGSPVCACPGVCATRAGALATFGASTPALGGRQRR
jgi:hypothetical protein